MSEENNLGTGNLTEQAPGSPEMAQGFSQGALQDNMGAFGLFQQAMSRPPEEAPEWSISSNGMVEGKIPLAQFSQLMGSQRQLQAIQSAFNAESLRLASREQQIRSNPLINVLTNVAAGLGSAPNMPGVVQGLAAANARLNPTADQLAQQRLHLLGQQATIVGHQAQNDLRLQQLQEMIRHHQTGEGIGEKNAATRGENANVHLMTDLRQSVKLFTSGLSDEDVLGRLPGKLTDQQKATLLEDYRGASAERDRKVAQVKTDSDRKQNAEDRRQENADAKAPLTQAQIEKTQAQTNKINNPMQKPPPSAKPVDVNKVAGQVSKIDAEVAELKGRAAQYLQAGNTAIANGLRNKAKIRQQEADRLRSQLPSEKSPASSMPGVLGVKPPKLSIIP